MGMDRYVLERRIADLSTSIDSGMARVGGELAAIRKAIEDASPSAVLSRGVALRLEGIETQQAQLVEWMSERGVLRMPPEPDDE